MKSYNDQYAIPEPDYENPKELYAFFGLAFYKANVLEQGVLNFAVAMKAEDDPNFTFEDFDQIYEVLDKSTFGKIIHVVRKKLDPSGEMLERLEAALEKRNYLAHRFFRGFSPPQGIFLKILVR